MNRTEATNSLLGERRGALTLGNLQLDLDCYRVHIDDHYAFLSALELDLLLALADRGEDVVLVDELTLLLWNATGSAYLPRLAVLVHRLRVKLAGSHPYRIRFIRGRGYGLLRIHESADQTTVPQCDQS